MKTIFNILVLLLVTQSVTNAATYMETNLTNGATSLYWIGKRYVHIRPGDVPGTVLVDMEANRQYMINHDQQLVIELTDSGNLMKTPPGLIPPELQRQMEQKPSVEFIRKGQGPEIVGYATTRYEVRAGGKVCNEQYLSVAVLKNLEIKRFYDASRRLSPKRGFQFDPCEQAEPEIENRYPTLGLPLRTIAPSGAVKKEILTIKTGIEAPEGTFEFPDDYRRTTLQQMMKEMGGGMSR